MIRYRIPEVLASARAWRAVALACLLIPAAACFERPIDDELEIRFLAPGGVVASSTVLIHPREKDEKSQELEERLARARRDLERDEDFWSRQFAASESKTDRRVQDRLDGTLYRSVQRLYLKDPDDLRGILTRSAVSVLLGSGDGWRELRLAPLPGARASEAQRHRSAELLEDWSARIARYLERTSALYRYLDDHPARAEACLGPLLQNALPWWEAKEATRPTEDERGLIAPVQESMDDVLGMFDATGESGWSPDEIVSLANDPFPSRLVVRVPGRVLESEGFDLVKEDRLQVPEGGLFGALASLEGVWISPDPLVTLVRAQRGSAPVPIDLTAFASAPRVARSGASAAEVRRALEKALTPASRYRVRWAVADPGVDVEVPDVPDWDALY